MRDYTRATVLGNLCALHGDNKIVEVRVLKTSKGTMSGYFNDMEKLLNRI